MIYGTNVRQIQGHADKVAALLVVAHGKEDSNSPITGTLVYAMKQMGLNVSK